MHNYVLTRFGHGKRHKQAKEYWSHFFLYRNLNCWRWEKTMKLIKGSDWPLYDLESKLSCINKWHNFLLRINDRKEYRYQCCIIYPSNICFQNYFSIHSHTFTEDMLKSLMDLYNSKCKFVKEWDKKPKDVGGQNTVGKNKKVSIRVSSWA